MFNPFLNNLGDLTESELHDKLQELTKKYYTASRFGNQEVLTTLQNFIILYKEEIQTRAMKQKNDNDDDFNQFINVD